MAVSDEASGAEALEKAASDLATELADVYGRLGGTRRRAGDLEGAFAAYSLGHQIEAEAGHGVTGTYNGLNRVMTWILLEPNSLSGGGGGSGALDVGRELEQLAVRLRRHTEGDGAADPWIVGDAALVSVLRGVGAGEAWDDFLAVASPDAAATYARTVGGLAELATPVKEALAAGVTRLEAHAR